MTRRVFLVVAGLLLSWQVASGQTYGPQPGAAQSRPAPQQTPQQQQRGPANAPQQQKTGMYPVRPAGGQQPAGPQPTGPQPGFSGGAGAGQVGPGAIPAGRAPQNLPPAQIAPTPQPPVWAQQMSPEQAAWLDQFLGYWESRSNKVKTFECKFQCWKYDAFAPPGVARVFTAGVVKYAQPDKGLYRVETLSVYQPPQPNPPGTNSPPAKPTYVAQDATLGEHWVCDGKQVFQFDAPARKVVVLPLPVEMQGKAIADGPLPFMFGAKAETIKARYWVRGLQGEAGKYLLEAVPKSRQDAQNFKKVIIQLDEKTYLPDMLQVFEPNSDDNRPYRKTYKFIEQQTSDDPANVLQFLNIFHREFYEPKIPSGWKKEVQSDLVQVMSPPGASRPPQEAQRSQKSISPLPR